MNNKKSDNFDFLSVFKAAIRLSRFQAYKDNFIACYNYLNIDML